MYYNTILFSKKKYYPEYTDAKKDYDNLSEFSLNILTKYIVNLEEKIVDIKLKEIPDKNLIKELQKKIDDIKITMKRAFSYNTVKKKLTDTISLYNQIKKDLDRAIPDYEKWEKGILHKEELLKNREDKLKLDRKNFLLDKKIAERENNGNNT